MALGAGEAISVLTASLQSGAGRARLDANTPNSYESLALTALTGSTQDIKASGVALLKQAAADMPLNATALLALASTDEWDDVVTVITS